MRILYYTHSAFWEQALSLVKELSRRAEVHLLVEVGPDAWNTAAFDVTRRELGAGLVPAGEVVEPAFPPAVSSYWRDVASFHLVVHTSKLSLHPSSWRRSREVMHFAESLKVDILHIDDLDVSPRLALALAQDWAIPIALNVHDPQPHEGESGWRKRLARSLGYRRVSRFILHNHSQEVSFRQQYSLPAQVVHVVELGATDILQAWADPDVRSTGPCVLFFGRVSAYKGLDVLYSATSAIASRVPHVRFVIAGKPVPGYTPPEPPPVPPPTSIEVRPSYIGNPTLARLLQEATLVTCPYTGATQSGVVLTAYGFDKPVVATAVGGLPEYVVDGRTGLVVPPQDPDALAAAISRILLDDELRQRLEAGVRSEKRNRLNWGRAADEMMHIYKSML